MFNIQIFWLSLIQGFTEFLPVSSSGHLVLFAKYSGFSDQGQAIDIALHIGSIIAVILYFWSTIKDMIVSLFKNKFKYTDENNGVKLAYLLVVATIPAILIGGILSYFGTEWTRTTKLIGWLLIIYSLLLWYADTYFKTTKELNQITLKDAILIGIAQTMAFLPGTSRSGITITMGRILGYNRKDIAKFSMLLSIPSILSAGIISAYMLYKEGNIAQIILGYNAVVWSFLFSLIAIMFMMKWLQTKTFLPFVVYRILVGILILLDAYNVL